MRCFCCGVEVFDDDDHSKCLERNCFECIGGRMIVDDLAYYDVCPYAKEVKDEV